MIFSKTCNYAIRAAAYVAGKDNREFVAIKEIAENLDISFHFLTKILQMLTQKNIMVSLKGPKGGVALARPAHTINLTEIIIAIDGPALFTHCVLGLDQCGDDMPCPLHSRWGAIRDELKKLLEETTLQNLAEEVELKGFRLTNCTNLIENPGINPPNQ